jgi:hypothetical protein
MKMGLVNILVLCLFLWDYDCGLIIPADICRILLMILIRTFLGFLSILIYVHIVECFFWDQLILDYSSQYGRMVITWSVLDEGGLIVG